MYKNDLKNTILSFGYLESLISILMIQNFDSFTSLYHMVR